MDLLELVRVSIHEDGAFGVLKQDGIPFALTLERTFDQERVVIPPGRFNCRRSRFFRGNYDTYEILVPGHDRVLFHIGNSEYDSTGCILLGLEYNRKKPGLLMSRLAFLEFMRRCADRTKFTLSVVEVT